MPSTLARLRLESLEDRTTPANLHITALKLVDGNDNPISAVPIGEQIFARAEWSYSGMSASQKYLVRFSFRGADFDSDLYSHTSSSGSVKFKLATWLTQPGSNSVSVKLDGDDQVAESDETDNTDSLTFTAVTPVGPNPKFVWTMTDKPSRLWDTRLYLDVDPTSPTAVDYRGGGEFTDDGHFGGANMRGANYAAMDAGIPVMAAAAGTVTRVRDGFFDRELDQAGVEENSVKIDHLNGWETEVIHLATNSITVKEGDSVSAGQLIGLAGGSGNASFPQVRFAIYHNGATVEPMYDPSKYFQNPPDYQGDADPLVIASGITNYNPDPVADANRDYREQPSAIDVFPTSTTWDVWSWATVTSAPTDQQIHVDFYRPDSTDPSGFKLQHTESFTPSHPYMKTYSAHLSAADWSLYPGTWQVVWKLEGIERSRDFFTVTTGAGVPDMRVREASGNEIGRLVLDNRSTPFDFGSSDKDDTPLKKSFTIENKGNAPLTLGPPSIAGGFKLLDTLPASIAPGGNFTFKIQHDTDVVDERFGVFAFTTNDPEVVRFRILLKGKVNGSDDNPILKLPSGDTALSFTMGNNAKRVASDGKFTDSDYDNFEGGYLRVVNVLNADDNDVLSFRHQGSGTGEIDWSGDTITYEGEPVANFTGGTGTDTLEVLFNENSTPAIVQAVLRNVTYQYTSTSRLDQRPRILRFTVQEPEPTAYFSSNLYRRVSLYMDPDNDAPVVNGTSPALNPVLEDATSPSGQSVLSFSDDGTSDPDVYDPKGIAVTGLGNAQGGTWQYSVTDGAVWQDFGSVSFTSARLLRETDLIRFMPAADANGTATIAYRAWDQSTDLFGSAIDLTGHTGGANAFSTGSQTATLAITPINDVPSFTNGSDQVVDEDFGLTTVIGWATNISKGPSNESSQTLTVQISNDNPSLFSSQPSLALDGTLTFRPMAEAFGAATVTIRLKDDGGTSNGGVDTSPDKTFTITVHPVNDPPSFAKGPNIRLIADNPGPQTVPGWATNLSTGPPNESAQILSFEITGNTNPGIFAAGPAVSSNGTLIYTPAANAHGYAIITLRARDDGGSLYGGSYVSPEQSFWIGINPINQAPTFTPGPDESVYEDAGPQSMPSATGIDPGSPFEADQVLTFQVTANTNPGLFATLPAVAADGTLTFTSALNAIGVATVTVVLTDDGGTAFGGQDTSVEESFTITVLPVNDAPSFILPASSVTVDEDSGSHIFAGWATDISAGPSDEVGQGLTFLISTNNNGLFSTLPTIDASGTLTFASAPNANGTATVTVHLKDDAGTDNGGADTNAAQTFTINLTPLNDIPSFAKGSDQFVLEDSGPKAVTGWATAISTGPPNESSQTLSFVVTTDNNSLFSALPAVSPTGTLTFTPAANANGSAIVTVEIKDDGGVANGGQDTSAPQTFTINVTAVNDVPSFIEGTNQSVLEDSTLQTIPGFATAISAGPADESGQSLTFLVSNNNNALFAVLPAIDSAGKLTYTPTANANGSATVTVQLMDDGGTDNDGTDTSATQTFDINVTPVNDAPVLDNTPEPALNPTPRNTPGTAGDSVASFVGNSISDIDAGALKGIAVVGSTGDPSKGAWQFSTNSGQTWAAFGVLSLANARLLRDTDRVRFVPAVGFIGTVTLTYHAWDRTAGSAGGTADLTAGTGGNTAFSTAVETASLQVATTLTQVPEDTKSPKGDLVKVLVQSLVTDADANAKFGIAVVGTIDGQIGTWQYSTTGGHGWKALIASDSAAILLRDTDRLRFVPAANQFGVATIFFHAWDRTAGTAGGTVDLTVPAAVGGATPFSTARGLALLQVTPVNDFPVLDAGGEPAFTRVLPGATDPVGNTVSALLGSSATDVDSDSIGMAVTSAIGTGHWQFKPLGSTNWNDVGIVSTKAPRLLGAGDDIRFRPDNGFIGTATIKYKAWDGTTTSKTFEIGSLLVTADAEGPPNNAPVVDIAPSPQLVEVPEDTKAPKGDTVANLLGSAVSDPDANALHGIAVTGITGTANGTWQYSMNGGRKWSSVGPVSSANALLLRDSDKLRFLPGKDFHGVVTLNYRAWDHTRGTAGGRANLSVLGGSTPFSTNEETASATVTPVNDQPTLDIRPTRHLSSVLPGAADPPGDLVSAILGNFATDVDGDSLGIAVTGASANGSWQVQFNGAGAWTSLGPVSTGSPRLLAGVDRIRLVPDSSFIGVAKLTIKASDGLGTSKTTESALLVVNNMDDKPVLDTKPTPILTPVQVGDSNPSGDLVSALLSGATDVDPGAQLGIAVTSASTVGGSWEVMTDGLTWQSLGTVSTKLPRLLRGTDRIRFVPAAGFAGTSTLKFKAWDAASADPNGPLALSAATESAIAIVNTAPNLSNS